MAELLSLAPEQVTACIEGIHHAGKIGNPIPTSGRQLAESYAALVAVARAAENFAALPVPLNSDERQIWNTKRGTLVLALARFGPDSEETAE